LKKRDFRWLLAHGTTALWQVEEYYFLLGLLSHVVSDVNQLSRGQTRRHVFNHTGRRKRLAQIQVAGYDMDSNVNPIAVASYAVKNGVSLHYQGSVPRRDDFVVDNYLCTGNPVLLKVSHGNGHFVLATGQAMVNGNDTFLINDPGSLTRARWVQL
jgi:hypothetical protein